MLEIKIRIYQNPWADTVPNEELIRILQLIARKRAEHVTALFEKGMYTRECLGLAILDPSAPVTCPSRETLLATIAIGAGGEDFVPNAIAKAVEHRDKNRAAGYGVYVDPTQSKDGDFCWGFSTMVDGTIAGASAQSEFQDACEAGHALVTFNCLIRERRKAWFDAHRDNRWANEGNMAAPVYAELAAAPAPVYEGGI